MQSRHRTVGLTVSPNNTEVNQNNMCLQATVFPALCNLVEKFRNFKVRINAALALAVPQTRAMYGNHFLACWTALLTGIDNSEYMVDFNEYKHRDGLLDQVIGRSQNRHALDIDFDKRLHSVKYFHFNIKNRPRAR